MSIYSLEDFVADCRKVIEQHSEPATSVSHIVSLMHRLLTGDTSFLKPEHFRSDPDHYARNAIYIDPQDQMSLYALVWEPGQWTPVHDHGTWGVVGIYEGILEESNYMFSNHITEIDNKDVNLVQGGVLVLSPESVSSFVPNPDHIHSTGNPSTSQRTVSLHLYGNAMAGFYIYDTDQNTRKWTEVSHNES